MHEARLETSRDTLEELLRVEMSAVEAYRNAVDHVGDSEHAPLLVDLVRDHETAAGSIRNALAQIHDQTEIEGSGAVGTAVRTVERLAALFGTPTTLRALRAGEETLLTYLATVADDERLLPVARDLVTLDLLTAVQRRIDTLDGLLDADAHA